MNAFSEKLKGTPLERKSRAYIKLQQVRQKHSGNSPGAADRIQIEFAAAALVDRVIYDEVIQFFIAHALGDVQMPSAGQRAVDTQSTIADVRHPNEGEESHRASASARGHAMAASSPSPSGEGSTKDAFAREGHAGGDRPSPPPSSGTARHSFGVTHTTPARGAGGPTDAQRAAARREGASLAAAVYEFKLRDGSKLGDVHFEDLEANAKDSLFEAVLFAILRARFPDAYGPVRKSVTEGQLERIKLEAMAQAKNSAPQLVEGD